MVEVLILWTKGNKNAPLRIKVRHFKTLAAKLGRETNYLTPKTLKFVKK